MRLDSRGLEALDVRLRKLQALELELVEALVVEAAHVGDETRLVPRLRGRRARAYERDRHCGHRCKRRDRREETNLLH